MIRPTEELRQTMPSMFRYQQLQSMSGRLLVVILREPSLPGMLLCDGRPLVAAPSAPCSAQVNRIESGDVPPGDRLTDPPSGLSVICPRGGSGHLTFDGRPLRRLEALTIDFAFAAHLDTATLADEGGRPCMRRT